jgi:hypothetical protein
MRARAARVGAALSLVPANPGTLLGLEPPLR